ncbi:hypothetical protein MTR67_035342 [Solanum verrucosum]|uniref:Uncharacterized protein n=1 Tax=Solanum verrucosum TaxID=315347 RepID=A0AAF0ZK71_SOLVR|nr:hypothetical protein MTR67_035342 [Solanum verrucosum]
MSGYVAEADDQKTMFNFSKDTTSNASHTPSTDVGSYVANINYIGLASAGTRGGAPMATIAVYATCWSSGCYDIDISAVFDDAIRDGVYAISVSLDPDAPQ